MSPSSASPQHPPRLVLGIDPGSSVTGWGLLRRSGSLVEAVDFGTLACRGGLPERLASLFPRLEELLGRLRPDCVAVEGVFAHRNLRSALTLAHARGVVLLACARAGLPVREIAPRLVKQAATGFGGAGKDQVAAMVRRELALGDTPLVSDAADALAVALCEARSTGFRDAVEAALGGEAGTTP